jgi:hypothetical protein
MKDFFICFTGRERLLEQLHEELARSGRAAISGLPGVGKTQSAIEYAHRHHHGYRAVLWTTAATRDGLVAGFGGIARLRIAWCSLLPAVRAPARKRGR